MCAFRLRNLVFAAGLACTMSSEASLAHEPASNAPASGPSTPSAEEAGAIAVVEAFSAALKAGDIDRAAGFLHADLLVLESGGAERSRAQYLAEHAGADAAFLRDARSEPLARRSGASGELAWVASESRVHHRKDGVEKESLGTETMVLRRGEDGWKIVHIHWSSRAVTKK